MSVFSGRMGRGAMRTHRANKQRQAFIRQRALWNDGTGYIWVKRPGFGGFIVETFKRVVNPQMMLPVKDRTLEKDG